MKIYGKIAALLCCLVWSGASLAAQTVPLGPLPETLTWEAARERFLQRNLDLEAARLQVGVAEAARVAAVLRPRPTLNVAAENLRVQGPTPFSRLYEAGAYVSQPIQLGGQRKAQVEVAQRTVSLAAALLFNVMRQRQFELRRAFYETLWAQARWHNEQENNTNFAEVLRLSTVRLAEGDIAEGELVRVRLEKMKYDQAVANARLTLNQSKITLWQIMGETDFAAVEKVTLQGRFEFAEYAADRAALQQAALANSPEVKVAEAEVARSQAVLRLERSRAKGEIVPYAGYRRVGPDNTVLAGVSVPLPFGNRNQGEIARADAEQRIAENALTQVRRRTRAEVEAAYLAYETAREQVLAYEKGVLEQAEMSRRYAQLAYREGLTEVVGLFDAQRAQTEIRNAYNQTLLAYYTALFQLELVTGVDLEKK
jgi:cobalt-zinc-cadmium efflux system outer membrane protein